MLPTRYPVLALGVAAVVALAGCATTVADDGRIRVVASTDVYGDIAATVGGDDVDVTSIIDSSAQDPHSYEASARDRLAVSRAQLVIVNGGGYDTFMDQLLGADDTGADDTDAEVLTAVSIAGLVPGEHLDDHEDDEGGQATEDEHADAGADPHGHLEGVNEHVWYDLDVVQVVASEIADHLAELDPDHATDYASRAAAFGSDVSALAARVANLATEFDGTEVAITEPVPLYLLEAAGLVNVTPAEFTEAIEEGTDVSPLVLHEVLGLFDSGTVSLLAYNDQTAGPETERVRATAEAAGVPVVDFAETLPDGDDYLGWMTANVDHIETALRG